MTRAVAIRPLTPVCLNRQRHGHKRKGKPVEAWKMEIEHEEKSEVVRIRGVSLNAIEQIADGVERMMFCWNLDTFERGQEHARLFNVPTAAKLDSALPPAQCSTVDDEEYSSDLKEDSRKACTVCHQFLSQQVTAKLTGPVCSAHHMRLSCSGSPVASGVHQHCEIFHSKSCGLVAQGFAGVSTFDKYHNTYPLQALPQRHDWITSSSAESNRSIVNTRVLEAPVRPSVTICEERVRGGSTVLEIKKDHVESFQIPTSEKNVGTEERTIIERPQDNSIQCAMTEFSPQLSSRGRAPSPDNQTLPPWPPPQRSCYPVNVHSCSYQHQAHGFCGAERHLQNSPRIDEAHARHAPHLCIHKSPRKDEAHARHAPHLCIHKSPRKDEDHARHAPHPCIHNSPRKDEDHARHAPHPCIHNSPRKGEAYACHTSALTHLCPNLSVPERQLHNSPRKGEVYSSIPAHSCTNLPYALEWSLREQPHSETEALHSAAGEVVVGAVAHTDSPNHNCKSIVANSGGVPHHCSSFIGPRRSPRLDGSVGNLEVGGRPVIMPTLRNSSDPLRNKFESLITGAPVIQGKEIMRLAPSEISSVEELQLALIECATEYEIKTLDAKMKMHELEAHKRQTGSGELDRPANSQENQSHDEMSPSSGTKRLEPKIAQQQVRKRTKRLEEMKENIRKPDSQSWKTKERSSPELKRSESGHRAFSRLFDRQRKSLDDALSRVVRLQREVVKKDRELVEWQLKEKETKAQLTGLEEKVKRSRVLLGGSMLEPRQILLEIPALRETLRSLKAEEQKQIPASPPMAETAEEFSDNKSINSDLSDRNVSLNTRLHCLEERTSEMDELKVTMSKLASNMAELSMAFKDHVQFVNHRLAAIHSFVAKKKPLANSCASPVLVSPKVGPQRPTVGPLKLAALENVKAEREITRSPRSPATPSWNKY